jgi:hypothetical protein
MLLDLKSKEYKNWDHRSQWQIEAFERIMKISGRSGKKRRKIRDRNILRVESAFEINTHFVRSIQTI